LVGQAKAGAQLLQVFDSWAGELSPEDFFQFSFPFLKQIADQVKERGVDVPLIVFAKGANYAIEELSKLNYSVVSLDWTIDPNEAKLKSGGRVALQGNLDPCVLYAEKEIIYDKVRTMLTKFGVGNHIANLGHGLHPTHDPQNVGYFIDAVHEISKEIFRLKQS